MKWPKNKRASVPVQQCMLSIEEAINYAFKNTETVDVIPVSVDARLLVPHLLFTNGVYPWFIDVAFMVMFQWYNPTYPTVQPGILRRLNAAFQANNSWTYKFLRCDKHQEIPDILKLCTLLDVVGCESFLKVAGHYKNDREPWIHKIDSTEICWTKNIRPF